LHVSFSVYGVDPELLAKDVEQISQMTGKIFSRESYQAKEQNIPQEKDREEDTFSEEEEVVNDEKKEQEQEVTKSPIPTEEAKENQEQREGKKVEESFAEEYGEVNEERDHLNLFTNGYYNSYGKVIVTLDDDNKLTAVDKSDFDKLDEEMQKSFDEMLSSMLNTMEGSVEKLAEGMGASKTDSKLMGKPFFVLDFSYKWVKDYNEAKKEGKEKADAMIEGFSNTWVDSIVNVGIGGTVAAVVAGGATLLGLSFITGAMASIFAGVWSGNAAENFLNKGGRVSKEVLDDIKNALSETIKLAKNKFK
jgi:hypothetical protein